MRQPETLIRFYGTRYDTPDYHALPQTASVKRWRILRGVPSRRTQNAWRNGSAIPMLVRVAGSRVRCLRTKHVPAPAFQAPMCDGLVAILPGVWRRRAQTKTGACCAILESGEPGARTEPSLESIDDEELMGPASLASAST